MLKLLKESFRITNDCIMLAIPLVLFMWILSFYLGYANKIVDSPQELILAAVTILFMAGATFSGWFYTIKKGIEVSKGVYVLDKDRTKAIVSLFKLMPRGIGRYFLSFIGIFFIFKICGIGLYFLINIIGTNLIGAVYTPEQASTILTSTPQELIEFIGTLSAEQLVKLRLWNLLIFLTTTVFLFALMFWIPEIIYSTPNPFVALFKSIAKIFKRLKKSICLFIILAILNTITSIVSTFALNHPLLYLSIMVLIFYYLIYSVVLIFSFYREEFCETNIINNNGNENEQKA
ncbi:hypothetical protein IKU74_09130 [bacterium]|nr:hypothetical protein [bacterium]